LCFCTQRLTFFLSSPHNTHFNMSITRRFTFFIVFAYNHHTFRHNIHTQTRVYLSSSLFN
jgi:hypothetical protein